jgi:hypothetical protein
MTKSLTHPNCCDNGCCLFSRGPDEPQLGVKGFCRVHGGETIISQAQYLFLQVRGCCSFGQCGDALQPRPIGTCPDLADNGVNCRRPFHSCNFQIFDYPIPRCAREVAALELAEQHEGRLK